MDEKLIRDFFQKTNFKLYNDCECEAPGRIEVTLDTSTEEYKLISEWSKDFVEHKAHGIVIGDFLVFPVVSQPTGYCNFFIAFAPEDMRRDPKENKILFKG